MPLRARILLFDGFDELDAIAPYEVLMNGLRGGAEGDVAYVTLDGAREVTASHGTIVRASAALGDDATLLARPRRRLERPLAAGRVGRGRSAARSRGDRRAPCRGATIGAVCTGGDAARRPGLLTGAPRSPITPRSRTSRASARGRRRARRRRRRHRHRRRRDLRNRPRAAHRRARTGGRDGRGRRARDGARPARTAAPRAARRLSARNFACVHVTFSRRWGILSPWLALSGAGRSRSAS